MPRDMGLPPPMRGSQTRPQMGRDQSTMGKLDQLAGQGGEEMGGQGGDQEAAQLIMSGTQQLIQAAQLNPQLQPMVMQAVQALKGGMERMVGPGGMTGDEGMGGEKKPPKKKKREKPPEGVEDEEGDLSMYGG
jgi:ABC-type sugar transport system substrate-binding protein